MADLLIRNLDELPKLVGMRISEIRAVKAGTQPYLRIVLEDRDERHWELRLVPKPKVNIDGANVVIEAQLGIEILGLEMGA